MLLFRQPTPDKIRAFQDSQAELDFTYQGVGETRGTPPAGYCVDHTHAILGRGEEVFAAARSALEEWRQFDLSWLSAQPANTPICQEEVVVIVAKSLGLWWLNACRIVYVIDEQDQQRRFGFAYGTLPDHAGAGEERFLIEMDKDGTVHYNILAFSRPRRLLSRLGYPYLRFVQKRFGKHSAAAMKDYVISSLDRE